MNNLKELLDSFSGLSLAVIGDICLDLYYFLSNEKSEISVETGLQTQSVSRCKHEAGGAANVAVNLKALGAGVTDLYGVVGDDFYGGILRQLLEPRGVNCSGIISQDHDWDTNVYHKVYREGREEPRYDMGNFNRISQKVQDMIFDRLTSRLESYQAIIINEQRTGGFHDEYFQTRLKELIKRTEKEILWLCDSRHLNMVYEGTIRKLNHLEAREICCRIQGGCSEISDGEMAIRLKNYWGKPVVLTRGEEGAVGVDQAGNLQVIPGIKLIGELDTVGGGDAFLAGLSLSLAAGADMAMALETANFTAAVSVTKLQETGHPTAQEVIEMGKS
jgi:rfaE bifunctional protein kinase chain/domain